VPSRGNWCFVPVDLPELDYGPRHHQELLRPLSGESTRAYYLVRRTLTNVFGGLREGPQGSEVCCPLPPQVEIYVKGGIYHEGDITLVLPGWHKAVRIMDREEWEEFMEEMAPHLQRDDRA
jgi:hypothetical protein